MIGKTLGHYSISDVIGKGGMGIVYRAHDIHLDRSIAIKVLPREAVTDIDRKRRFMQEAKAASALNHPNIITIHDISQSEGVDFIAMEYVDGKTLDQLIRGSRLDLEQALQYAIQISGALAAAHAAGIIHRDLKPTNIMVTEKGLVKVLDFGLAKLTECATSSGSSNAETMAPVTEQGTILGTAAYMSPEQAEGKPIDASSDVFSFGSVLYEMVTGQRAFQGESHASTLSAILRDTPKPLHKMRADVPSALEQIVSRCMQKSREARYASAGEVWKDLLALKSKLEARRSGLWETVRKPRFAIPAIIVLAIIVAMTGWRQVRSSRVRWAQNVALPQIAHFSEEQRGCAALSLLQQAEPYLEGDPELKRWQQVLTRQASIITDPPGADVFIRDYVDSRQEPEWTRLGTTPLDSVVVPAGYLVYKVTKSGFDAVEGAISFGMVPRFRIGLRAAGTSPPGMVWVPPSEAGAVTVLLTEPIRDQGLQGFWLDRYEVTNRQFKEFVDRGGYEKKEYWKHDFVKEGRVVPWEQAMASFRDSTGRPGPSTWEFGAYSPDRAEYPVTGISWYEAAAYAQFAGKSLPTLHHWSNGAGNWPDHTILKLSNFAGKGPARVGSYRGLSPYGNYDMAGNVKEWCWNESGPNRYILGGAWTDPNYSFLAPDVRAPMDRSATNGFRCAKYLKPPPEELTGAVRLFVKDRRGQKPVEDKIFQTYKAIHQYDHGELKGSIDSSDGSSPYWTREKVSFQAAYRNERVIAYLYLPKDAKPPFQTVIHFPGAYAIMGRTSSSQSLNEIWFDFLVRSKRAVVVPIYKGTYERNNGLTFMGYVAHTNLWRETAIEAAKDFGRTLDYLDTRPEIDHGKMAFCGFSMGASEGPRLAALEPRIKACVLLCGGAYEREWLPEVDPFNFAPRVHIPVLMLSGKYDVVFPLEGSQITLFSALGAPEKDKRHIILEAGHGVMNQEVVRETLGWLDRYLGPVRSQ